MADSTAQSTVSSFSAPPFIPSHTGSLCGEQAEVDNDKPDDWSELAPEVPTAPSGFMVDLFDRNVPGFVILKPSIDHPSHVGVAVDQRLQLQHELQQLQRSVSHMLVEKAGTRPEPDQAHDDDEEEEEEAADMLLQLSTMWKTASRLRAQEAANKCVVSLFPRLPLTPLSPTLHH